MGGQLKAPLPAARRLSSVKNAGWFVAFSTEKMEVQSELLWKYCGPKFKSTGALLNRRKLGSVKKLVCAYSMVCCAWAMALPAVTVIPFMVPPLISAWMVASS